ncbi:extradiol ring-cleavage dioxygenase [Ammoniphilus sp. 3BR4]|uniref:DODA-type extradiol aromatic ring-opening family dioxygenase n=1 Tax=Ammoniphilus sp. 3BR4 TaxID=3158265 RepID=UPI0034657756
MTIGLGVITAHVPRICFEDKAPAFYQPLIQGMKEVAKEIERIKPDAVVLISTHWQSTFDHFVDATPRHKGVLTAFEAPDLISDVHYDYPGDEQLAKELVAAGKEAGLRVIEVNDPTYVLDYGTVVPLRYLVPNEDIPVIELSCCWAANLEETFKWGRVMGKVMRDSQKKIVFVSSGALSHNLVRGPEIMPTLSEQAMDRQFIEYLEKNDQEQAWNMLPQYARAAGIEAGGRHLAALLGVLEGSYKNQFLGYGQSSGSGNIIMTFTPQ